MVAADEAAVGAERLAERAGDDVDLALEAGLGDRAATAGAERAERVRLVDEHADVVAARELDDLRQRGDVAVHAEHAVGRDQRRAPVALAQRPREVLGVGVAVGDDVGAREPAAVDDRGVAELVVEDDLAPARERRDHAHVGERRPSRTAAPRAGR